MRETGNLRSSTREYRDAGAEVLSHGDRIEPGGYRLHSSFAQAVNYARGGSLLTLVSPGVDKGPVNIQLGELPSERPEFLQVFDSEILISGCAHPLEPASRYISTVPALRADARSVRRNLLRLERVVARDSAPLSYTFLLDPKRRRNFRSAFELFLLARVTEGWRRLERGDFAAGTRLLKGTGYGFTPSGDDFIAGYLAGLSLAERHLGRDTAFARSAVYAECDTENVVSHAFIRHAMAGCHTERIRALVVSLLAGSQEETEACAAGALALGETSGSDFCTGLVFALQARGRS